MNNTATPSASPKLIPVCWCQFAVSIREVCIHSANRTGYSFHRTNGTTPFWPSTTPIPYPTWFQRTCELERWALRNPLPGVGDPRTIPMPTGGVRALSRQHRYEQMLQEAKGIRAAIEQAIQEIEAAIEEIRQNLKELDDLKKTIRAHEGEDADDREQNDDQKKEQHNDINGEQTDRLHDYQPDDDQGDEEQRDGNRSGSDNSSTGSWKHIKASEDQSVASPEWATEENLTVILHIENIDDGFGEEMGCVVIESGINL